MLEPVEHTYLALLEILVGKVAQIYVPIATIFGIIS
jgi:hypothetical protein